MNFCQTNLREHHELEFTKLGRELRKTKSLRENLQILTIFYPPTSWFVSQFFLETRWPVMENLREFNCCPINNATFQNIIQVFEEKNFKKVQVNHPQLRKVGFHFNFNEGHEFRQQY